MKKFVIAPAVIVILISLSAVVFLIYDNHVMNNSIALASKYYEDRQYDLALNNIQTVLIKDPKNIPANDLYRKILEKINEERDLLNAKLELEKKEDKDWKDSLLKRISDLERKMGKTTVIERNSKTNYVTEKPDKTDYSQQSDETVKDNSKKIAEYLEQGKQLFNNKQFAQAKVLFLKVLNLDKNNPKALVYLGSSIYNENPKNQNNHSEIKQYILSGLQIDPEISIGHKSLAQIYENEDKNEEAVREYRIALEYAPDDEETLILLAKLQYKLKETKKSEDTFAKANELNNSSVISSYYLARTKIENGNKEDAEKLLLDLLKKAPDFTNGYLLLGDLYKEDGKYNEAVKHYDSAVKLDAQYSAYQGLGDCYYNLNSLFRAEENYIKAVKNNPLVTKQDKANIGYAYERMAIIEMKNDRILSAGEYAQKALENEYKSADIFYIIGSYKSYCNFDDEAVESFGKCLSIDENHIDCYAGIGRSYLNINNNNMAVKYSEMGIAKDKSNYKLYLNEADALKNLGEYEKAIEYYGKSLSLKSSGKETLLNTGLCYKAVRNYDRSCEYFLKAVELDKNYFDAYFELGDACFKANKYKEAKSYLEEIVKRKPNYERRSEVDRLLNLIKKHI